MAMPTHLPRRKNDHVKRIWDAQEQEDRVLIRSAQKLNIRANDRASMPNSPIPEAALTKLKTACASRHARCRDKILLCCLRETLGLSAASSAERVLMVTIKVILTRHKYTAVVG